MHLLGEQRCRRSIAGRVGDEGDDDGGGDVLGSRCRGELLPCRDEAHPHPRVVEHKLLVDCLERLGGAQHQGERLRSLVGPGVCERDGLLLRRQRHVAGVLPQEHLEGVHGVHGARGQRVRRHLDHLRLRGQRELAARVDADQTLDFAAGCAGDSLVRSAEGDPPQIHGGDRVFLHQLGDGFVHHGVVRRDDVSPALPGASESRPERPEELHCHGLRREHLAQPDDRLGHCNGVFGTRELFDPVHVLLGERGVFLYKSGDAPYRVLWQRHVQAGGSLEQQLQCREDCVASGEHLLGGFRLRLRVGREVA